MLPNKIFVITIRKQARHTRVLLYYHNDLKNKRFLQWDAVLKITIHHISFPPCKLTASFWQAEILNLELHDSFPALLCASFSTSRNLSWNFTLQSLKHVYFLPNKTPALLLTIIFCVHSYFSFVLKLLLCLFHLLPFLFP
jgi:hypothetical protein